MSQPQSGIYRHYKGPLYQVLGLAHDANAGELYSTRSGIARSRGDFPLGERTVVVYFGLQLDAAKEGPRLAVRTVDDFVGYVHRSTGETCVAMRDAGRPGPRCEPYDCVSRFRFLGRDFRAWMLDRPVEVEQCDGRCSDGRDVCALWHGPR